MPIISTSLPADGETIDAADVNTPFNDILNVVNGNLDSDNVATGGLNYENFGTITGEIPASDMQDSGNVEKFRDEANVAFVASGCVWSTLSGLDGAMTAGVVYNANGVRNTPGAVASKTFTASRDTYVDIATNGSVSYSEVTNGAASPALTSNYVRVAKVVTSGSAITSITQSGIDSLSNPIFPTYTNPTGFNGAWQSWTPTFTNLTVGDGTLTAKYTKVGKTVRGFVNLIFGSTTSISSSVSLTTPSTMANNLTWMPMGLVRMVDEGTDTYAGAVSVLTATTMLVQVNTANATYSDYNTISGSVPFTWTTSDRLIIEFCYEEA